MMNDVPRVESSLDRAKRMTAWVDGLSEGCDVIRIVNRSDGVSSHDYVALRIVRDVISRKAQ